jgi:hypothetical protein
MSTEKARWAKLAGLPKTTDKQQLDENFIGHQMVGNIFDREKEKYEDAFEYFLSEKYENKGSKIDKENVDEALDQSKLDLDALKFSILRAIPNFTNKEDLENHILGLIDGLDEDLFDMEIEVDLFDKR